MVKKEKDRINPQRGKAETQIDSGLLQTVQDLIKQNNISILQAVQKLLTSHSTPTTEETKDVAGARTELVKVFTNPSRSQLTQLAIMTKDQTRNMAIFRSFSDFWVKANESWNEHVKHIQNEANGQVVSPNGAFNNLPSFDDILHEEILRHSLSWRGKFLDVTSDIAITQEQMPTLPGLEDSARYEE